MIPYHIRVTALTARVHPEELSAVASALQIQVMRDFFPEWGVSAIVSAAAFNALPAGTIPVIVHDDLDDTDANGFHRVRRDDSPYIVIPHGPNWSLAASHALLRMLANPTGSARVPGQSRMHGQGTVEYLLDVCGPCQDVALSYTIDGVAVADFCSRGFYAGFGPAGSFAGGPRLAFEPGPNGIVTWLADDGLLYQARADGKGQIWVHGGFSPANRGGMLLGELVERLTPGRLAQLSNAPRTPEMLEAALVARRAHFAGMARFHEDIAWRFGGAPKEVAVAEPSRPSRRRDGNAFIPVGAATRRVVKDPAMTVRSPS